MKVLRQIVDNHNFAKVSPNFSKVLHVASSAKSTRVTVETLSDVALRVQLIEDPVCVVLQGCSKDNDLPSFADIFEKLLNMRSDPEETSTLVEVHQCFIHV